MPKIFYPGRLHWRVWWWLRAWLMLVQAIIEIFTLTFVDICWSTRMGLWIWKVDDDYNVYDDISDLMEND